MPGTVEMELGGRGIALVPSVFVGREPSLHENPNHEDEMPRLILPAEDAGSARLWAALAIARIGAGRAGRPEPGGGAAEHRGRVHHHRAGPPGRHLARRGQPARLGAARGRPHRHPPPGQRGAARAHAARRGTAAGRLTGRAWYGTASEAPAFACTGSLLPRNRTRLRVDHRLWFPSSSIPSGPAGGKAFQPCLKPPGKTGLTADRIDRTRTTSRSVNNGHSGAVCCRLSAARPSSPSSARRRRSPPRNSRGGSACRWRRSAATCAGCGTGGCSSGSTAARSRSGPPRATSPPGAPCTRRASWPSPS